MEAYTRVLEGSLRKCIELQILEQRLGRTFHKAVHLSAISLQNQGAHGITEQNCGVQLVSYVLELLSYLFPLESAMTLWSIKVFKGDANVPPSTHC